MTTIDLDFEIINKSHETDLLNSIQDILNVKNVKLNNPLINDYIFKVFKNKIEYNELYIPKDEIQQSRPSSSKRPNTPIHNLQELDDSETEEHLIKCVKKINSGNTSLDCNLSSNNSANSCNDDSDSNNDSDSDSDNDSDISTSSINSDSSITLLLNNKKKKEDIQKLFNKHNYNILTKYKLEKLNNVVKEFDDTNNIVCDLDLNSLTTQQKNTFIKISPLVEPVHYIKTYLPSSSLNNNNNNNNNNHLIPDINTLSLVKKINSKYNSCYVEAFMGLLLNKLVETNICIGYPHFYGCFTGIKENIHFDISEDYDDIKHKSWFKNKEHSTLFTKKTIYEEETSDEEENNDDEDTNNDGENNEEKTNNKEEIIEEILDLKDLDILDEVLDIDISPEELELNLNNKSKKSSSLKSNHSSSSTYSIHSNNSANSYTIDNISECSDIDFRDKIDVVEFPQFPINASIMEKFEFTR